MSASTEALREPRDRRAADSRTGGFSLEDRYTQVDGRIYLSGVQALVRMLLDRQRYDERRGHHGSVYVTGYEGSPLAGYDLEIKRRSRLMAEHRIVHAPALNEELAATALAGTQLAGRVAKLTTAGVTGVWYGKAPGLDRATDAIRHAAMIGTSPEGGVVALVGDDPSAKSSSVPSSSEPALADLQLPTFYPSDSQEVLEHGLHAVEISRASGLWAAIKVATNVADGASTAAVRPDWSPPGMDDLPDGLRAYAHVPHARLLGADLAALERSLQQLRWPVAFEYLRRSGLNRVLGAVGPARLGIVAAGKTYLDVCQALASLGIDEAALPGLGIRLLKLGVVVPVEPTVVREFARGLDEIVVVEDKRAFIEVAVKEILYGTAAAPVVLGKRGRDGYRLFRDVGELDPDLVAAGLATWLRGRPGFDSRFPGQIRRPPERIRIPVAARSPYFCSGCPHNSSTKVPEGAFVGAGIGCHAMVLMMPREQVGEITGMSQMGGEGAQWIGMAPFVEPHHFVQNLGDGTFAHSGSLAVRAAVASGTRMTFKVLYNSTVAMTGGQDAVGGGGGLRELLDRVLAEGVTRVVVTTDSAGRTRRALRRLGPHQRSKVAVRRRDELLAVQAELARTDGVTVVIHDQECAAEKRRKRKRGGRPVPATRIVINERVCEGCGDCGRKSNCLSVRPVETAYGRKTRIHQSSCNLDYSCLEGDCPSFLAVTTPQSAPTPVPAPAGGRDSLPDPVVRVPAEDLKIRIVGVGGTGVVTVAQVIATAAAIDGRYVRALDQTGLAQKGGAVVSDVKISTRMASRASKLAGGECDLYLGCDSLVATDPAYLAVTDPERTIAIVSTAEVPTGHMVVDPALAFPPETEIRAALDGQVAEARFLPADVLARQLFGDEQFANMIMVGAAYQAGALPLPTIEEAIRLNGAAVDTNLEAFLYGRAVIAGRNVGNAAEVPVVAGLREPAGLSELIASRAADLVEYHDRRYAESYTSLVSQVRDLEAGVMPGRETLTEAVARNLYKLMAYKDEYEVARLSLDPALEEAVRAEWGAGARITYRLHPPVLRALGMRRKVSFGPWARPAFRALRSMRRLRGTVWDPFGHTHVRRIERELVAEYRTALEQMLGVLNSTNYRVAVEMASLPDQVRGYEEIKMESVRRYRQQLRGSLGDLSTTRTVSQQ